MYLFGVAKLYEASNHLGNVLVTISDKKLGKISNLVQTKAEYYEAIVKTASDYYPFGWQMPNRKLNTENYSFGFNGMESNKELNEGSYDFGARIYDGRIARWLSVDPLEDKYPFSSPYNFVANMPTRAIDPDGKKIIILGSKKYVARVKEALMLLGQTQAGYETIMKAIQSDDVLVIQLGAGINEVYGNQPNGDGHRRKYLDLDIFNLNSIIDDEVTYLPDGSISTIETILNHELTHFLDNSPRQEIPYENYIDDETGEVETLTFSSGELKAVAAGNEIRATFGKKLRTLYGGINVYDKYLSDKQYSQFENNGLTSAKNYWELKNVPEREKFDPSKFKDKVISNETFYETYRKIRLRKVKHGDYNNRRTYDNKQGRTEKFDGELIEMAN